MRRALANDWQIAANAATRYGTVCSVAAPDLPGPHEPFSAEHLARWPTGAERTELVDGEIVWLGSFDERDAVVARRAFLGHRIRVEVGVGLIAGPVPKDHPESREWTDPDGTHWHLAHGMQLRRDAGARHWVVQPRTRGDRQRNREQLAAARAEEWAATVAAYAVRPDDVASAFRYLVTHPISWSWLLPAHLADTDASSIGEATWARTEAESWLSDSDGLTSMDADVDGSGEAMVVTLEHGPVLWPLDVPAEHRTGMRAEGTPSHDPGLDVAEPTWESAIVALAGKVRRGYRGRPGASA
jgi:hypothetical protein